MNLATVEPALLALVASLSGLPASACVFENAPRPIGSPLALLSWVSVSGLGQDGVRWDYAAAADPLDEMTPTVQGTREARLQIAVEVYADQRAAYSATALCERIRDRLDRPSARAALEAVDVAVATKGPVTRADYVADARLVSRGLFEVVLNAHASESDTAGRTSYIATVEAVATIRDAGGTTLPVGIQPTQG